MSENGASSNGSAHSSLPGSSHYLPHQIVWRVCSTGISAPVIEPILQAPTLAGKLTIHIHKARRLHNVSTFGQMNPYVEVKINESRVKTSVCKHGHVQPDWTSNGSSGEKLEFTLSGQEGIVRIRVFHKTLLGETVIGTARLPLDFLLLHHGRSARAEFTLASPLNSANPSLNCAWVDIGREAKQAQPAGSVLISVYFELLNQNGLIASSTLPPSIDEKKSSAYMITADPMEPRGGATLSHSQSGHTLGSMAHFGPPQLPHLSTDSHHQAPIHVLPHGAHTPAGPHPPPGKPPLPSSDHGLHPPPLPSGHAPGLTPTGVNPASPSPASRQHSETISTPSAGMVTPFKFRGRGVNGSMPPLPAGAHPGTTGTPTPTHGNGGGSGNGSTGTNSTQGTPKGSPVQTPRGSFSKDKERDRNVERDSNGISKELIAATPTASSSSSSSSTHSSAAAAAASSTSAAHARLQLFGGSLDNGMKRSKSSVPVVVFITISYLLHHGLKSVGLFRVSSSSEQQDALKQAFENGANIEVSDPYVTGDVLKSYFRSLADPLIPSALYQAFLNATDLKHEESSVPLIRKQLDIIHESYPDHYNVLSYLLHFLTIVAKNSDVNKMTVRNCAMVFSPNLLRRVAGVGGATTPVASQETQMREMQKAEDCLYIMILRYDVLFTEGPPTPFSMTHPSKERPSILALRKSSAAQQRRASDASPRKSGSD